MQIAAGFIIIILLAVGSSYFLSSNTPKIPVSMYLGKEEASEIILRATFPSGPSTMMAYTVVPDNSPERAQEIAKKLGISKDLKQIDDSFYMNDGDWIFSYLLCSGAFDYFDSGPKSNRTRIDMPEYLPGEKEATTIAESYLKAHDLWEEEAVYDRTIYQYGYVLWGANNTKQLVRQTMDVQFRRISNGYPIDGDGIRVSLGGHGDVIEVSKVWRTYIPDKEYQIITAEEAYRQLVKDHPTFPPTEGHPVTVTGIYLGYVTRPRGETMDLLKPAYAFEYETEYDGDPVNGTWYIPAVPELGNL